MGACRYCGRYVSPNARTCPGCGEPDPWEAPRVTIPEKPRDEGGSMWSALSSLMGAIVVVAGGVMLYAYSAAIKAFLWNVLTQVVAPIFIAFVVVAVVIGAAKS